ncbi:MAG: acetoacetate decarboxylase family protein [Actinomycetia bacterium]|nr:acetoacetate decarboxylase family protein [Actinomycetes bacterium]
MDEAQLAHLPYPLPPWQHRFRTLSVFCEVDEKRVAALLPPALELRESVLQSTVMRFDSTVPSRPYHDSAVIAPVRFGKVEGGYWVFGYTSTDQVLSATRELWGFKMKLADRICLDERGAFITGRTERHGATLIAAELGETGEPLDVPATFPRLFWKVLPRADRDDAEVDQTVMMDAETQVERTVWGRGSVQLGASDEDRLNSIGPFEVLGASFVSGHQILPWGRELA